MRGTSSCFFVHRFFSCDSESQSDQHCQRNRPRLLAESLDFGRGSWVTRARKTMEVSRTAWGFEKSQTREKAGSKIFKLLLQLAYRLWFVRQRGGWMTLLRPFDLALGLLSLGLAPRQDEGREEFGALYRTPGNRKSSWADLVNRSKTTWQQKHQEELVKAGIRHVRQGASFHVWWFLFLVTVILNYSKTGYSNCHISAAENPDLKAPIFRHPNTAPRGSLALCDLEEKWWKGLNRSTSICRCPAGLQKLRDFGGD